MSAKISIRELSIRVLSALILLPIVLFGLFKGGYFFGSLLVIASTLMLYEWLNLTNSFSVNKFFSIWGVVRPNLRGRSNFFAFIYPGITVG